MYQERINYLFVIEVRKGNHVHSILEEKNLKDEKLDKITLFPFPEVRSDFYLDIFDRTLINIVKSDE